MYNYFKALNTDIVFNVLYIYFILFYIMYYIHIVKRFRAHCGFYAIENKLLLLLLSKLSKLVGILYSVRRLLNRFALFILYFSLFLPYIT